MDNNTALTFTLTVDEANAILGALGDRPYAQVAGIIAKLQSQAQEQIAAAQSAEQLSAE